MPHLLKNENLEIHIDLPDENYNNTRFDWSGKITKAVYKGISFGTVENPNSPNPNLLGQGFCNEFGIDSPLGFAEAELGEWFHKIGAGVLKKETDEYNFMKKYAVRPCDFKIQKNITRIQLECASELVNGYAYQLSKTIRLNDSGFTIDYFLKNMGEKTIKTSEYNHNFLAIGNRPINGDYILKFPFRLNTKNFSENVSPEGLVAFQKNQLHFLGDVNKTFFFSYLNGADKVSANWKLEHTKLRVGVKETGDFFTSKINLWGLRHVISPELFFDMLLKPSESVRWSREYAFYTF